MGGRNGKLGGRVGVKWNNKMSVRVRKIESCFIFSVSNPMVFWVWVEDGEGEGGGRGGGFLVFLKKKNTNTKVISTFPTYSMGCSSVFSSSKKKALFV